MSAANLTNRALAALPAELRSQILSHVREFPVDGLGDLIAEAAIGLAESDGADTLKKVFGRVRSNLRRAAQAARMAQRIAREDALLAGLLAGEDEGLADPRKRSERIRLIAESRSVTIRQARNIYTEVERLARLGDEAGARAALGMKP